MGLSKKQLAKKLASHRLTIVQEAGLGSNDPDVIEYKAREKQAKQRAERTKQLHAEAKERGFKLKVNKNHPKYNNTLASKLDKAING